MPQQAHQRLQDRKRRHAPAQRRLLLSAVSVAGLLVMIPAVHSQAPGRSPSRILRIGGLAGTTGGVLRQGPLQVTVTREVLEMLGSRKYQAPVVRLRVHGKPVGTLRGVGSEGGPSVVVQLAEMDPTNPYPEVLLSSFSFGAHCCNRIQVLSSNQSGTTWREVRLHPDLEGGATPAQDPLQTQG